ncbi:hypothetical protein NPIL_263031 [Nephila pilipes]|uniref:Uncharacterized protein n=1 Tax=Nephila pilipes TaxID=299642 RepID=A0A8X6R9L5_NEPPI|nr:hypothetical protein NPIL_41991 [Nephila pilipes]GFU61168.1 hypothetical protein NPIL_263031 [Nephila pilipes]
MLLYTLATKSLNTSVAFQNDPNITQIICFPIVLFLLFLSIHYPSSTTISSESSASIQAHILPSNTISSSKQHKASLSIPEVNMASKHKATNKRTVKISSKYISHPTKGNKPKIAIHTNPAKFFLLLLLRRTWTRSYTTSMIPG